MGQRTSIQATISAAQSDGMKDAHDHSKDSNDHSQYVVEDTESKYLNEKGERDVASFIKKSVTASDEVCKGLFDYYVKHFITDSEKVISILVEKYQNGEKHYSLPYPKGYSSKLSRGAIKIMLKQIVNDKQFKQLIAKTYGKKFWPSNQLHHDSITLMWYEY